VIGTLILHLFIVFLISLEGCHNVVTSEGKLLVYGWIYSNLENTKVERKSKYQYQYHVVKLERYFVNFYSNQILLA
jgi:hypothetical protein